VLESAGAGVPFGLSATPYMTVFRFLLKAFGWVCFGRRMQWTALNLLVASEVEVSMRWSLTRED
jgi:hypothetical protein